MTAAAIVTVIGVGLYLILSRSRGEALHAGSQEASAMRPCPQDLAAKDGTTSQPGMTATIDSEGKFIEPGPDQRLPAIPGVDMRTSDTGLPVTRQPEGKGEYVDLQGRFQNTVGATIDDEGKLTTTCDPKPAEPPQQSPK